METESLDNRSAVKTDDIQSIEQFLNQISPELEALLKHSVYSQVKDVASLRIFMQSHVFAVWDFMTLLKMLQRQLTCLQIPWSPPQDVNSARLINEIVLAEETDEVEPGRYSSHFDLYIAAMKEVGADMKPIFGFLDVLKNRWGATPERALAPLPIPQTTKDFVNTNMEISTRSPHEVAAAFLFGREEIIPSMFRQILRELEKYHDRPCPSFRMYLERHIHLDETQHAPMGRKLLANLCQDDSIKWGESLNIALKALHVRQGLWDGVARSISAL